MAPDSPHTRLPHANPRTRPRTRPRARPLNCPLADDSREGQTGRASAEDGRSRPGSAGQEPSCNIEVSNLEILLSLNLEHLQMQSATHEGQPSQLCPLNTPDEDQQPLGSSGAADDGQQLLPGLPSAANEGSQSPAALPGSACEVMHEGQQSQPASRSTSPEMQGRRLRSRKPGEIAADSPSSKRRKVDCQADSAGFSRRTSNRNRRPTTKAANER